MPEAFDVSRIGLEQETYDTFREDAVQPRDSKVENLGARKDEKLSRLSSKVTPEWVDTSKPNQESTTALSDDGEYSDYYQNKISNDLSGSERQYLLGELQNNLGVYKGEDSDGNTTLQTKDAQGNLVDYTGPTDRGMPEGYANLYGFGTKGNDEEFKLGTWGGIDAEGRYRGRYEDKVGPEGVNAADKQMELILPKGVVDTYENLSHGNKEALAGRSVRQEVGQKDAYFDELGKIGTGGTEVYENKVALFGDSRDDADFNKKRLYEEFLNLAGYKQNTSTVKEASIDPSENLRANMLQRESSGNYEAVNDGGYVGGYQFGAAALEDLGYVNEGTYSEEDGNSKLNEKTSWSGKEGINSLEDYLASSEVQDKAFEELTEANYSRLVANGTITDETSTEDVMGYVAASHLVGAGNARDLQSADANGTKGQEYFDLGKSSYGTQATPVVSDSQKELDAYYEAKRIQEAEDMGIGGRLLNGVDAAQSALIRHGGLNFADWVGETLKRQTGYGWDLGTDEEITAEADSIAGYNRLAPEKDYAEAKALAQKIHDDFRDPEKSVELGDVGSLVLKGATTPELAGESIGFLGSLFVPILGWGGKAVKVNKAITAVEESYKAGKITKEASKEQVKDLKSTVTMVDSTKGFFQTNAGLLQVSAGNVNQQIDEYTKLNDEPPSVAKITQMYTTEVLMLGTEKWVDLSILKTPALFKEAKKAASTLTSGGKAKVATKVAVVTAGLAANMGKEAAQEYAQSMGEVLNVQWNFDDNGNIVDALGEAGEELSSEEAQVEGIMSAGLGAGGAVQFQAIGTAGSLVGKGIGKVSGAAGNTKRKYQSTDEGYEITATPQRKEEVADIVQSYRDKSGVTDEGNTNYSGYINTEVVGRAEFLQKLSQDAANPDYSEDQKVEVLKQLNDITSKVKADLNKLFVDDYNAIKEAGQEGEAKEFRTAIQKSMPDLVQQLGSDPELLASMESVTKDMIVDSFVSGEKSPGVQDAIDAISRLDAESGTRLDAQVKSIDSLREVVESYTGKDASLVKYEVLAGPTGMLSRYIEGMESEAARVEQENAITKLVASQDKKIEILQAGQENARAEIDAKVSRSLDSAPDMSSEESRGRYKESLEYLKKNDKNKVTTTEAYAKVRGKSIPFTWNHSTIAEQMIAEIDNVDGPLEKGLGGYTVLKSAKDEAAIGKKLLKALIDGKPLEVSKEKVVRDAPKEPTKETSEGVQAGKLTPEAQVLEEFDKISKNKDSAKSKRAAAQRKVIGLKKKLGSRYIAMSDLVEERFPQPEVTEEEAFDNEVDEAARVEDIEKESRSTARKVKATKEVVSDPETISTTEVLRSKVDSIKALAKERKIAVKYRSKIKDIENSLKVSVSKFKSSIVDNKHASKIHNILSTVHVVDMDLTREEEYNKLFEDTLKVATTAMETIDSNREQDDVNPKGRKQGTKDSEDIMYVMYSELKTNLAVVADIRC